MEEVFDEFVGEARDVEGEGEDGCISEEGEERFLVRVRVFDVKFEVLEDDVRAGCSLEDLNNLQVGGGRALENGVGKNQAGVSSLTSSTNERLPVLEFDS